MKTNNRLNNMFKGALVAMLSIGLMACGETESKKLPEDVAKEFIEAIYNTKDI